MMHEQSRHLKISTLYKTIPCSLNFLLHFKKRLRVKRKSSPKKIFLIITIFQVSTNTTSLILTKTVLGKIILSKKSKKQTKMHHRIKEDLSVMHWSILPSNWNDLQNLKNRRSSEANNGQKLQPISREDLTDSESTSLFFYDYLENLMIIRQPNHESRVKQHWLQFWEIYHIFFYHYQF